MLLFAVLCTGLLKLEHIEKAADFLLAIMPLMFIPPAVGIVNLLDILADSWWKIVIICIATTFTTIALTGETGGRLKAIADICICAPSRETYKIQEYHLPIYHMLCIAAENEFFDE